MKKILILINLQFNLIKRLNFKTCLKHDKPGTNRAHAELESDAGRARSDSISPCHKQETSTNCRLNGLLAFLKNVRTMRKSITKITSNNKF